MLPRGSLLTGYRRFNYFCFSSYVLWSGQGNVDFPDQAEGLVAAAVDLWWMRRIERRHRVLRMLKIRHQVVRCADRESLDVRILYDRRVELNDHGINQRQDPAVVLSRILSQRLLLHARRHRTVEDHVGFLEWIHGEAVQGTDGSQVLLRAKPGVLRRPRVFPRNVDVVVLGIAADVVARGLEILAVNVNPRIPGRVLRLAEDVGTVVNAVEVDRLVIFGVFLDVVDCVVRLAHIEGGQIVPSDLPNLLGWLAGDAFPLEHIHDAEVLLGEFRIVRGEPRMEPRTGIGVGIDAGIIGRERLHLVEAVHDWIRFRFVAEMPFAREVRRVAVLLEELGNRRSAFPEKVLVTGGDHN